MEKVITVEVSANGSVSIEHGTRIVAMSRFSGNAQVIAAALGTGKFPLVEEIVTDNEFESDVLTAIRSALG